MNRKKVAENPELTVTNYDLSPFMPQNSVMTKSISFENESVEILREKLVIKSEALNLLGKQLELCNKEKNEYKRLIDTLYDKNLFLKKSLYFKENHVDPEDENFLHLANNGFLFSSSATSSAKQSQQQLQTSKSNKSKKSALQTPDTRSTSCLFNDIDSEDYLKILKDLIKTLQKEKCDLIQKHEEIQQELNDSRNDLRLLREQIVRQRVGSYIEGLNTTYKLDINDVNLGGFEMLKKTAIPMSQSVSALSAINSNANSVKEGLIKEIEQLREQKNTIENDLRLALCQKEEIEIERDSYKEKYIKLNKFLVDTQVDPKWLDLNNNSGNFVENLDRTRLSLNIDEIMSQNKYLAESNRNLKEELDILKVSPTKQQQQQKISTVNTNQAQAQTSQYQLSQAAQNSSDISQSGIISKQKVKIMLVKVDQYLAQASRRQSNDPQDSELFELISELKTTIETLIEGLNDKLIANAHQRKVNKMLAERIQDLERQLNSTKVVHTSPLMPTDLNLHEPLVSIKKYNTNEC